jgi:hypothetical protein
LRRWLVLLLVLAVAVSGLLHLAGGGHAGLAAAHSHDLASVSQDGSGEPCCHEHDGQSHATVCSMANGCALCVPVVSAALLARSDADPAEIRLKAVHSGRVLSPQFRPPKLFANA